VIPFDFRPAESSMTYDSFRGYLAGFREWPDNWYGFFPGNPGPASSVMLPRTSILSTNRRKCSVEDGQGELYCDHHSSIY